MNVAFSLFVAAPLTALCAAFFARRAPRFGWLDAATPATLGRKLQDRPIPPVGGAAILAGLCATAGAPALGVGGGLGSSLVHPLAFWPAIVLAFALGLVDDLRRDGLGWRTKLAGQALVALALVTPSLAAGQVGLALAFGLACIVAQNAWNTFDNADGAATALGAAALAPVAPPLAAILCGFLPLNLALGRRRAPAYLGDAGSHLIGVWIACHPSAWPALTLPLADLARLAIVRIRTGSAPWIGDRRHLAHRLERRGLGPIAVVAALVGIALPSIVGGALGGWAATSIGCGLTLAAFGMALGASAERSAPSEWPQ